MDLEQELVAMWQLVTDLSDQLQTNRELAESLQAQAKDVKGQAIHSGTGFPLRRFNIDISDEQFTSELEKFASHLVLENQSLQHENKQLNVLLKEYEQTLEGVMAKFRGVSYAATQHELTLHQYYTSLLHEIQTAHSTTTLLDSNTLSTLLTRLSTLLRAALRNANGEDEAIPLGLEDALGLASGRASANGSGSPLSPSTSAPHMIASGSALGSLRLLPAARRPDRAWLGDLVPAGGYAGTDGRRDWALEREIEVCRLAEENRMLREMLAIEADVEAEFARRRADGSADDEDGDPGSRLLAAAGPGSATATASTSPLLSGPAPGGAHPRVPSPTAQPTSVAMQASTSSMPAFHEDVRPSTTSTAFADLLSSLATSDPTASTLQGQPTALGAQPAEMVRSISSPSSAGSALSPAVPSSGPTIDSRAGGNGAVGSGTSSNPASPIGNHARSPIRRDRPPHIPPSALSPPVVKASIPLPTLGHASGMSSGSAGPSTSPNPAAPSSSSAGPTPLSSLFLKAAGGAGAPPRVKSEATTAVSVGEDDLGVERVEEPPALGLGLGMGAATSEGKSRAGAGAGEATVDPAGKMDNAGGSPSDEAAQKGDPPVETTGSEEVDMSTAGDASPSADEQAADAALSPGRATGETIEGAQD